MHELTVHMHINEVACLGLMIFLPYMLHTLMDNVLIDLFHFVTGIDCDSSTMCYLVEQVAFMATTGCVCMWNDHISLLVTVHSLAVTAN